MYFEDGELVSEGDLLVKFDTTRALNDQITLTNLIEIEEATLSKKLRLLSDQEDVLNKKVETHSRS